MASPGSPESIRLISSFRHPQRLEGKRREIELIGQISHDVMRASHFNREYKSHIARPTGARCATAAGRGAGKCWPMSKTRTARQADERWLHESSFSLLFCLRFALREMVPTGALLTEHMRSRPEVAWRQFPERLEAFLTRHTRLLHKLSRFITTNVAWLR
jgi:hypothetical protein